MSVNGVRTQQGTKSAPSVDSNGGGVEALLGRIEGIARKQPDLPAANERGGEPVSYARLMEHAGAVRDYLIASGVGAGDLVGLDCPRCVEWVSGLLGIWMADAVPLMIDVAWPSSRRESVFELAPPKLLLSRSKIEATRRSGAQDRGVSKALPPATPAYVIATSGSSGTPKAVQVSHDGVLGMIDAQIEMFALGKDSRCLWIHNPSFDASISDVGTALAAGACLCIDPILESAADLARLVDACVAMGITHIDLPPALLGHLDPRQFEGALETVIIGGEVAPPAEVRLWSEHLRVVSVYGPTEATVCTSMVVAGADWSEPRIGKPIPGISYSVLDGDGCEAGVGGVGELYIEGDGVALCYLGDPALTEDRFYEDLHGRRCYRTGDVVRRTDDGDYLFVGRSDRQCKIRGLLVCPEEVEAALVSHPKVSRAFVAPLELRGGETLLGALAESAGSTADELREHLRTRIPEWMHPTRLETVEELPVLPNGKLDSHRAAERLRPDTEGLCDRPGKTEVEDRLRSIFAAALGGGEIGAGEDFFGAGGDSLATLRVLAAADSAGIDLTADCLSTGRTAAGVAALMSESERGGYAKTIGELEREVIEHSRRLPVGPSRHSQTSVAKTPRTLLMTGATGFLGGCLLGELLSRGHYDVVCLCRGGVEEARRRLSGTLADHGFSADLAADVRIVRGEIADPRLGLGDNRWDELVEEVDVVVHCAGDTRLLADYGSLAGTNVVGTRRILEFALAARAEAVHHVSTLAVFLDRSPPLTMCREDDSIAIEGSVLGGYSQSKWVADRLVAHARNSLPLAAIYRPGLLVHNRRTGHASGDWLDLFLSELEEHQLEGLDGQLSFDFTPVDGAAEAIARIIVGGNRGGPRNFHVTSGKKVTVDLLRESLGLLGRSNLGRAQTHVAKLASSGGARSRRSLGLFKSTGVTFSTANADESIGNPKVAYQDVDADELARMIARLRNEY